MASWASAPELLSSNTPLSYHNPRALSKSLPPGASGRETQLIGKPIGKEAPRGRASRAGIAPTTINGVIAELAGEKRLFECRAEPNGANPRHLIVQS